MTLSEVFNEYKVLVEQQATKPTKKRITEIRKALLVIKKACDTERKSLLPPKPVPIEEVPIPEMVREVTVSVDSTEPIELVKIKQKKRKTKKSQLQ